ncbi:hypothetical protein CEXT_117911 [Caerostris extrusa]|uniref:Uncharacterized protein n=1 Tax=Caerostris extrusa TaxID=172846 RepID=A0AAV4WHN7_CAEEX|nr:hypothetical protein CEXT_117911 [Caerostris extrusa]
MDGLCSLFPSFCMLLVPSMYGLCFPASGKNVCLWFHLCMDYVSHVEPVSVFLCALVPSMYGLCFPEFRLSTCLGFHLCMDYVSLLPSFCMHWFHLCIYVSHFRLSVSLGSIYA